MNAEESPFTEYLKCFRELTLKERDVLMDLLKIEVTPVFYIKEEKPTADQIKKLKKEKP